MKLSLMINYFMKSSKYSYAKIDENSIEKAEVILNTSL